MRYQKLGNTGLFVSELCLGTMTFGGEGGMWAKLANWIRRRRTAGRQRAGRGINFIDTANVYSEGRSEQITGQALKNLKVPRENVVVATKVFGETGTAGVNSRGSSRYHIIGSVKESLRRLQLDHIDLYQLHGFDPATPLKRCSTRWITWYSMGMCATSAFQLGGVANRQSAGHF
jgi:aryl-alcohol dehydrogenase-like predicted oxidoreductase